MSTSTAVAVSASPLTRERMERMFYLIAGIVMLGIVGLGFQHFYLHGRANDGGPVTQQITPLVFLHGILMTAWIIAFVVQSGLIVNGNRRLHMTLGVAGAVLAGLLVVVGITTAIASVHYNPDGYKAIWGARRFLSFMLINILGFGAMVGVALQYRRRPEIHRPLMLLGTLFVAGPAGFFRIPAISNLVFGNFHTIIGPWIPMLVLGAILLLLKSIMTMSWDGYLAKGFAAVILTCVAQYYVAYSSWWNHVAGWVTA
jgi:hypothetical protein